MRKKNSTAGLILAGLLTLGAGSAMADATSPHKGQDCFFANQWEGWKAPNPDVIYIRVNLHDIYRLDLSAGSSQLLYPDSHLVTIFRGSDVVCSPLDLDLYVSDGHGFREPLIVKSMTKLSAAEAAAIPPKFRP